MKIFIAWSKDTSGAIGNALRKWLMKISKKFTPIISTQDIALGSVWRTSLGEELTDADYGVLCVTEDNLESPWLCYEAGALGISTASHDKEEHKPRIAPILFGNVKASQVASPIQDFQSKPFTRDNMLALALDLTERYRDVSPNLNPPDERDIERNFNASYEELESEIQAILKEAEETRIRRKREAEETHIREKLDEFDKTLKDFQLDNGDDEMIQMGNLVFGKLRADFLAQKGLTKSGEDFANKYLELLRSNENAKNAVSARHLQSVLSELIKLLETH